jgi:DNA repair protein RadC
VHNHPSGHPAPSTNDHAVTKRIHIVGQEIGIPLLDHLIIGDNHYFSYAEETDYLQ